MASASSSSPPIFAAFSIFLLSRLALHFAEEDSPGCPPFRCGNLNFSYSFDAAQRKCGLSTIQCEHDKPMMASEEGRLYEVKSIIQDDNTIVIRDVYLSDNLVRNDCSGLYNFSTPIFPTLILKEKDPDLFLFKCGKHLSPPAELLPANFGHFNRCKDYNLFYYGNSKQSLPHAHAQAPVPAPALPPVPDGCSVFHLPLHSPFDGNWSATLLSFLLDEGFYLQWSYPPGCHECEVKCPGDPNGALKCADTKPGGKKKLDMKLGIAVSGIAIGLIVTIIVLLCCLRRKFSSHNFLVFLEKETKNDHIVEALFKNYGPLSPRKYSYSDIKKITNSFKEKLGQGGYGVVYKGKLVNSRLVAVKVLSEFKGNGEEFVNEIVSICRTSHVNIVTLVGFCFEGRKKALVYEFMPNGSLEKFIYDRKSSEAHHTLEWESLYKIAIGIARGLEYLHRGCNTRILHFDIKPHNILLDQDLCPKISDFGLAKLCPNKESIISMLGARGTIGYTAPEVFCRNFGGISPKSDVYSYGMMVLEMVGGRKNTDVGADHTSEIFFPHWIYKRLKVDEDLGVFGLLTRVEEEIAKKMTLVGLWCIQTDPLIRPSMSKVVEMLEGSLDSLRIPPKPYLSSPSRSPEGSPTTWERSLTISLS